jgi:hypothetical protein
MDNIMYTQPNQVKEHVGGVAKGKWSQTGQHPGKEKG